MPFVIKIECFGQKEKYDEFTLKSTMYYLLTDLTHSPI